MKIGRVLLRILAAASLLSLAHSQRSYCQGESTDDVTWQHYQHVLRASTLEWSPSQPFLLKVEFQLYDLDGNPSEKGTAEESWTVAGGKIIRIQSPSLTEGDGPIDEARLHTRESYLIHQAINAISRPFPSPAEKGNFTMDEFQQTVGGFTRSCFALEPPGTWKDANPAYCTDIDNRLIAMTGNFFAIERSDFRKYRDGHETPVELQISYQGKPAVTLHVSELDMLREEPASVNKLEGTGSVISGAILAGSIIKKKNPVYPKEAKKKRIGGSVLITAMISKEGTISYLDVVASPNALLSQSAMDAVKTWTYTPYLLNGKPTEVDTTIVVNYNINR